MTDAEQVACDALRSAGLDEVADNLAFAREAVKVREQIIEDLTCDVDGCCAGCGVFSYAAHRASCRLWNLLNSDPAWLPAEIERAHEEALRTLFNVEPASYATWRGDASPGVTEVVVRTANETTRTVEGRMATTSELLRHGAVIGFDPSMWFDSTK